MKDIKLDLANAPTDQPIEVILREGAATQVYDPVQVVMKGTISAPGDFYTLRKERITAIDAHVEADFTKRTIKLRVNDADKFGADITGELKLHPELTDLKINQDKTFDNESLYGLLKFRRAFFKDKDKHAALLGRLKDFSARISQEFQSTNDFKGSIANKKITKIKTDLDLEFILSIPIFAGSENEEFKVDIMVDGDTGGVRFWLESIELHEKIIEQTETIFQEELERFDCVIVSQY